MNALRSIIFNFLYIFGSLVVSLLLLWSVILPPRKCAEIVSKIYSRYILLIAEYVMGIKLEMRGLEHLPPAGTPYIIAAKHQSAFETLVIPFLKILNYPVIILKKELTYLPVWGLFLKGTGQVPIDRSAGIEAMRAIAAGCEKAMKDGRCVAIFPQGTRVTPGVKAEYKTGIAKIYKDLKIPVVPMALNSGLFWGKNKFFKKPGTIVFEFLPPIPAGQPPLKVTAELEQVIEAASDRLMMETKTS